MSNLMYANGFDAITKEFIGLVAAYESPLEPGVFPLPANATLKTKPETAEHEVACFENDDWVIKPDYRGEVWYTAEGVPAIVNEIGEPEGLAAEPPPPTFEQQAKRFEYAVQQELDADAVALGYDNILSACSYAGAPNPFKAEAELFIARRGNAWAYSYAELIKVQNGTRPMPTIEAFILELPARVSA